MVLASRKRQGKRNRSSERDGSPGKQSHPAVRGDDVTNLARPIPHVPKRNWTVLRHRSS